MVFSALPVLLFSYLIISLAIRSGKLTQNVDAKAFDNALKNLSSTHKKSKIKTPFYKTSAQDMLLNKWLFFGSGFYGVMAFGTYVCIETLEIFNFIAGLLSLSLSQFFSNLSINMLVDFIVNAILNLVDAFVWFNYWMQQIDMQNGWFWLVAAYLGFLGGSKLARRYSFKKLAF